jgi:NAD-dependent dihydropyrimidine dehydrogenase PreA subunit
MERLAYLKNVSSLALDATRCKGCGMCTQVCPHGVLSLENGKTAIGDLDSCMECGACALNCRRQALTVSAGVGCAAAIIKGAIKGTEPACGCSADGAGGSGPDSCC